ncbi:hypothetical protein SAMN04489729_7273 [Amycolatopsis lurida]|nr:hypothetical protein [Amycolatopsis lurida]SEE37213.1 hypothetical protein SAMN04489729_7273 [Amycolatopsis lurida]
MGEGPFRPGARPGGWGGGPLICANMMMRMCAKMCGLASQVMMENA